MATPEYIPSQDTQERIDAAAIKFQQTVDPLFEDPILKKLGIVRKTTGGPVLKLGHVPSKNPEQVIEITRYEDFGLNYVIDQTAVRSLRRHTIDTSSTWVTLPREGTPGSGFQDAISDNNVFSTPEDGVMTPEDIETLLKTIETTADARRNYHRWD